MDTVLRQMTPKEILEHIDEFFGDEEILKFDDLDEALIGWTDSWSGNTRPVRLVYSHERCVQLFMDQGMTYEDAEKWMEVNVVGAYIGESTPVIVRGMWFEGYRTVVLTFRGSVRREGNRGSFLSAMWGHAVGPCGV